MAKDEYFGNPILVILHLTNQLSNTVLTFSIKQGTPLTVSLCCISLLYLPIPYKFCVQNLFMITSSKLFSYLQFAVNAPSSILKHCLEKLKICMHIFLYM